MSEIQMTHGFRNVPRLIRVKDAWLAFTNGAEATVSRADIAAQHECRDPVRPALKDVRAARFLTHRVQVQAFDQLEHMILIRGVAQTNLKPLRLGLTGLLIVSDYSKFSGQNLSYLIPFPDSDILA